MAEFAVKIDAMWSNDGTFERFRKQKGASDDDEVEDEDESNDDDDNDANSMSDDE